MKADLIFIAIVLLAFAALASHLIVPTTADGATGALCEHRRDCGVRELCVADTATSYTGRCVVLRVLP